MQCVTMGAQGDEHAFSLKPRLRVRSLEMVVLAGVYHQILDECSSGSVESGGILGGANGVVNVFQLDIAPDVATAGAYSPNVDFLNTCLTGWAQQGHDFCGMVHSHFQDDCRLSCADLKYIARILNAMPMWIDRLYFPLVFPRSKQMLSFLAIRTESGIELVDDEVSTT